MSKSIWQDWEVNPRDLRMRFILSSFRFAQKLHRSPKCVRWLAAPYLFVYQLIVWWEFGIELNHKATIGPRLRLHHGYGLVIHEAAVIGSDCTLRHGTTIGNRSEADDCPVIGDRVDIGCNSVLIGRIRVGDDVRIGAGSVVLHDVPAGCTVAGNPARPVGA